MIMTISVAIRTIAMLGTALIAEMVSAHEFTGPQGTVIVDWQAPNIARVTSSGYGDAFGLETMTTLGFPYVETIGDKSCVNASFLVFDVADDFAFDIDEDVQVEMLFDRERTSGFFISHDRNALSEAVREVRFSDSDVRWKRLIVTLARARFANRGQGASDFAIAALSAMWPGIPDEEHRFVLCELTLTRPHPARSVHQTGRLEVIVRDADTREQAPVRMGLYDETGRMPLPGNDALTIPYYDDRLHTMFLRRTHNSVLPWPNENRHFFYSDGIYTADVPTGRYQLVVSKGPEYVVVTRDLVISPDRALRVDVELERWTDMPANGWYSGDDHIHIARSADDNAHITRLMRAEDVHVSNILQMGNPAAMHFRQYAFGETGRHIDDASALVPGIEDPRTAVRGHTIRLNIDQPVRDAGIYLQYDRVYERYRAQGALSGFAHIAGDWFNVSRGAAVDVPLGNVDFFELLQDGTLGTDLWYDFLNLGYRIIPTAGSDFPYLNPPGAERIYVYLPGGFSVDRWYEGLAAGRNFVTNGPMLEFEVNGMPMGSTIDAQSGDEIRITARATLNPDIETLDRLELVVHGEVVASSRSVADDNSLTLGHATTAGDGAWIAVRAFGVDQAIAHSSPVYVQIDGEFLDRSAVPQIVAEMKQRLDEFERLTPNIDEELEPWEAGDVLQSMWVEQRARILRRIAEARAAYNALLDQ